MRRCLALLACVAAASGLRRVTRELPTMTEKPPKKEKPLAPSPKEPPRALSLRNLLGDAQLLIQIVKWSLVLGIGLVRAGSMLLGEAMMRSFYRTVVVIELRGVIADDRGFVNSGMWCLYNADNTDIQDDGLVSVRRVERALDRAFSIRKAKAVVLRIASPGGTASESALLHARLKSLKNRSAKRHAARINRVHRRFLRFITRMKPSSPPEVLAYVDELCTSGGYFAASAADSIVASPCALVGSIGVIQRGFGFHRALRKDGVERRILAAGDAKAGLDPYLPKTRPGVAREKAILKELHDRFVTAVKEGRGDRLQYYAAADLAAEAQCTSWPSLSPAALAACWPNRIVTRHRRAQRGAGLFDGSVHGALTALKLGLVDDVVEETFPEAMKQRYGRRIFLKRLTPGRDLRPLVRPPPGPTQWK